MSLADDVSAVLERPILDRRGFHYRLAEEIDRALRYQRDLTVFCVDVSGVDPSAENELLEAVSRSVRLSDVVGRGAVDSLVFIFPETAAHASVPARRVLNAVQRYASNARGGLVRCPHNGTDSAALLSNAERALEEAAPGGFATPEDEAERIRFEGTSFGIIVADPAMKRLFALVRNLAKSTISILISGETGVGKEVVATALHHWSKRCRGPFVSVNCAAIPATLLESELFGHERGAFSGADVSKPGLIEAASNGTLFLDEISEAPLELQAKLLRFLETLRIRRVGENRERHVDVRVVAATNRALDEALAAGTFRKDLYYRLGAARIVVPPLRERAGDIVPLAQLFLSAEREALERPPVRLSPQAVDRLSSHPWPGNVRELKNLMAYLAAMHPGPVIEGEAVELGQPEIGVGAPSRSEPSSESGSGTGAAPIRRFKNLKEEIRDLERRRIEEALMASNGVRTRAAALLGMPLRTLVTKLKVYGLSSVGGRNTRSESRAPNG